ISMAWSRAAKCWWFWAAREGMGYRRGRRQRANRRSGCSTFLKTIAGEMNGIHTDESSKLNYQGTHVSPDLFFFQQLRRVFRHIGQTDEQAVPGRSYLHGRD